VTTEPVRADIRSSAYVAIFNDYADAQRAAQAIQLEHPLWWVHAGALS
jgi:4-diphosphocytidyl-2-C-methyl-D-erythritol kinase